MMRLKWLLGQESKNNEEEEKKSNTGDSDSQRFSTVRKIALWFIEHKENGVAGHARRNTTTLPPYTALSGHQWLTCFTATPPITYHIGMYVTFILFYLIALYCSICLCFVQVER